MEFNRKNLRDLHRDIEEALRAVAREWSAKGHTINVEISAGRFSPTEYHTRVTFNAASASASVEDRARREFEEYAGAYGLKSSDFGVTFSEHYPEAEYTICGIKPRSHKYPILCRRSNGTVYKLPAHRVLEGLGRGTTAL